MHYFRSKSIAKKFHALILRFETNFPSICTYYVYATYFICTLQFLRPQIYVHSMISARVERSKKKRENKSTCTSSITPKSVLYNTIQRLLKYLAMCIVHTAYTAYCLGKVIVSMLLFMYIIHISHCACICINASIRFHRCNHKGHIMCILYIIYALHCIMCSLEFDTCVVFCPVDHCCLLLDVFFFFLPTLEGLTLLLYYL